MARYRARLPQVGDGVFLTDSGIETVLIFHHGYELPDFAAFVLLDDEAGAETFRRYYREHAAIARDAGTGFIFESPTWRASPDWADRLGYSAEALAAANRKAIDMLVEIRAEHDADGPPMVVSGCVGPRGDGYQPSALMTADEVLDDGDPHELGRQYELLRASLPAIGVLGRCCGTDLRHVEQIAVACVRSG
jgi:S-methylmethionine-dependent homocysteine/selenocysteine methylase